MNRLSIHVSGESDIAEVVRQARSEASRAGFSKSGSYYLATVASELASNLFIHAGGGVFEIVDILQPSGLELSTIDDGPGIANVEQAMQEGFSTTGSLGCGLPGIKRLTDELEISARPGGGTVVRARKWL